ncbi:MAG: VPLPA-CTERM sorting domain-containing protein [Pseudomonadota bacterium]
MMRMFHAWAATALLASTSLAHAAPVTITATGNAAADIAGAVDTYRGVLGDLNPFEPQNFAGGRRQIDWDAAPDVVSDPNAFPGDFFNFNAAPRARGIEFEPTGSTTGFQLSSTAASGTPVEFGFDDQFSTFSPERLFAPVGGTTLDVKFFDPADQTTPATTRGLGVVFTDVEIPGLTTMTFFDRNDNELGKFDVPTSDNAGLSFLGVAFDDPEVFRVSIVAGLSPIDGALVEPSELVAMDDFIFGEMTPVPLPASVLLLGAGIAGLGAIRRMRAR